jgi:glycosyltransferase involved in cell wall biosynthesis
MRITFLMIMGVERPSGRRYFQIARGLARRGHRVRLLALHPDLASCRQRRFVAEGVEVWYVGQMHARKAESVPGRFGPLALLRVLAASTAGMVWGVICSPAEIYHLGKPQPVNGLAALIAVRLLRRRPFYVDCDDDEVRGNRLPAAWQRAVFGFWQWLLPRLAAGATVNTRHLAAELARAGVAPITVVPNGVDVAGFRPPPPGQLAALRAALGLRGRRVVAYAGTLALQNHPVDLLLDAFARIADELPDTDLLLIGGGEDLPLLQARAAQRGLRDRLYFTGQVPHAAVPAFLALADLSVDPVRDDPVARARSPLKLFESMAIGVPVITGDVGDRAELLNGGSAGALVPPDDPAALADMIAQLLRDEPRRAALAAAGRDRAAAYDWDKLAERWAMIYSSLA